MTEVKHTSEASKRHYEALRGLTSVNLKEIAEAMAVCEMFSKESKARGISERQFILAVMITNVGNFQCVSTDPAIKATYLEGCERIWEIFAEINPR